MVFLYGFCLQICLNSCSVFLQWWVGGINPFFSMFLLIRLLITIKKTKWWQGQNLLHQNLLKYALKEYLPFTHFRCLIFRTLLMWKKVETIHPVAHSFFILPFSSCKSALYFLFLIIQLFPIPYKQYPVAFVTENDAFKIHPCCSLCQDCLPFWD